MKHDIHSSGGSDKHIAPSLRTKAQGPEIITGAVNPLDSDKYKQRFRKLQQWRRQARVAQSANRAEMAVDEDFYDTIQLAPEDLQILNDRNQPANVYNVIKHLMNSLIGAQRASKQDYKILPRKKSGAASAKAKTKVFKYITDISKGLYACSEAFTEAVCAGLGWLEFGARNTDEILFMRSERWRNMWYDHLSIQQDGSDMRFVLREKWVDLDIATAMFPDKTDDLKVLADGVNSLYPYHPDDPVTDSASEFDLESDMDSLFGGSFDGRRERIKLVEMQYRMPANVQIMKMRDDDTPYGALHGAIYRPEQPDHKYLVDGGYFTVSDAYKMVVRHAMWAGKTLLQDEQTPYNHNRFSFVPIFCYRRKRDNMPYGMVRDLRGPQIALNLKKLRTNFLIAANQHVVKKGAVDDKVAFHTEMQRPDGIAEVNEMEGWKQVLHGDKIQALVGLTNDDERFMYSTSSVTADAEWQTRKELSGKAMEVQANQSQQSRGMIFDNYQYAFQAGGEILLSNIEQFYDQEQEIRITGDQQKDEFIEINKINPDGSPDLDSAITHMKADFIVGHQDFRESIRQWMVEKFFKLIEIISKVTPEGALSLMDLAVELMDDLINKDEAVARIRKINGQHGAEDEMTDQQKAELVQRQQAEAVKAQQNDQVEKALQQLTIMSEKLKNVETQSKTDKNNADALVKKLEGFLKALEVAGTLKGTPELVTAADHLVKEAGTIGEEQTQTTGGQ